MIRVQVSEAANADLDGIYDYGFDKFGDLAAETYVRLFDEVYDRISEFPFSGVVHHRVRPPIRSLPCGSHRVYYDLDADRAIVRRVLHKAMDVERHL